MLASLPMYDLPEVRAATDIWWQAIARALQAQGLNNVPPTLSREGSRESLWRHPRLLLTQTCGYPLTHQFAGTLQAVAVPSYRASGCGDGHYRSAIVVRADDPATTIAAFRGRTLAANSPDSHSGCNCLIPMLAPLAEGGRFFTAIHWSGAHRASLAAVRTAAADIAAIDAVTWALIGRYAALELSGLRVLCWSAPAPALPYATTLRAPARRVEQLRDGLDQAMRDGDAAVARARLLLADLRPIGNDDYATISAVDAATKASGYRELSHCAQ